MSPVSDEAVERSAFELLQGLMETLPLGIVITDPEGLVLRVNPAFSAITGYTEREVSGRSLALIEDRDDGWARRRDGSLFPRQQTLRVVHDRRGEVTHRIAVISDLTQHHSHADRIERLAFYDDLTGLPNRQLLLQRLAGLIGSGQHGPPFAVLLIDLDRFKTFNDSLGHPIGDDILREAARRIEAAIRRSDMVSRQGGDEFIVVLTRLNAPQDAAVVASNILAAMARPVAVGGHQLTVTPSIGISLFPHDAATPETLLRCADTAMYHAKERGRNNYQYYTPALNQRAQLRMTLETELRAALAGDELSLHYQPQVRWRDGAVVGAEALLRWRKADGNWIGPAEFIPVAEECGLIVELGQWVLDQACRQRRLWNDQGLPVFPVAVNCSALQFRDEGFQRTVTETLDRHGLGAEAIELEITESVLMDNPEATGRLLEQFRAAGIRLALDDFGTGYSSLAYLRRFAVDRLKIDAAFIRDLDRDATNRAIVQSIVALGESLGLDLVAEGVETEDIGGLVASFGCHDVQGFGVCRPLPAEELEAWFERRNAPAPQAGSAPGR